MLAAKKETDLFNESVKGHRTQHSRGALKRQRFAERHGEISESADAPSTALPRCARGGKDDRCLVCPG